MYDCMTRVSFGSTDRARHLTIDSLKLADFKNHNHFAIKEADSSRQAFKNPMEKSRRSHSGNQVTDRIWFDLRSEKSHLLKLKSE